MTAPNLTFREWLKAQKPRDTPTGMFIALAQQDKDLPDANYWWQIKRYLECNLASYEMVRAGKLVWERYRGKLKSMKGV